MACILAAFADGAQSEIERSEIKRIISRFTIEGMDLAGAYQQALAGNISAAELAKQIASQNGRWLAYEMAVCVCNVDGSLTGAEQRFLDDLRQAFELDAGPATNFRANAADLQAAPFAVPPIIAGHGKREEEIDEIILNRSILAGALELMPQTLATMAIVPVQMRLVYQIGKRYSYDLDWAHAKEFLATVGIGLTSQAVEGYLTRFVRSAAKRYTGKMLSGLLTQAAESALAFGTTYAIGQAAKSYYSSGRTLSAAQLQNVFGTMLRQGRDMREQYAGQILDRSRSLNIGEVIPLLKSA
jgi:uncharacterized protein (DUF697 family)